MSLMKTERRLCDDDGMVSDELVGDPIFPELTFAQQMRNLRRATPNACDDHGNLLHDYDEPWPCTGSAHLAGMHITCTSPAHRPSELRFLIQDGKYMLVVPYVDAG